MTAQAEGNTEYWECDRCGLVFADAGLAQVIEKVDTVLPKLEAPAPAVPMQPTFPTAQQVVLAPLSLLPKTGREIPSTGSAIAAASCLPMPASRR